MPLLRALTALAVSALLVASAHAAPRTGDAWPGGRAVVGYTSQAALRAALARGPARIVRWLPALHAVEVRPSGKTGSFAAAIRRLPGIAYVEPLAVRARQADPALAPSTVPGGAYEWQYAAARETAVPDDALRAARDFTIAVIDTGADLTAPDLAAKSPATFSILRNTPEIHDTNGHGTFVAALAAGSTTNGEGIAGFGGDAQLLIVQAGSSSGSFSDLDEASAIVYAVDRGAKIINLSIGGKETSSTEESAIQYAVNHGVLVVASVGNDFNDGNPVEYPAALLQPVGSNGQGGVGLAVAASDRSGAWAGFSNSGSWVSLSAPGLNVFSAIPATMADGEFSPVPLPGSRAGRYAYGSGTSFAAPEVAGAAALVWAANPLLSAQQVARILKDTATGKGSWNDQLGFGVIDVAAAVARAAQSTTAPAAVSMTGRQLAAGKVKLTWTGRGAALFRVTVRRDGGAPQVLVPSTAQTSGIFDVAFGHAYSFTVAAIDATGAEVARAQPYVVALRQAAAALTLAASRPVRDIVVVTARLFPGAQAIDPAGRTIVLETFRNQAWQHAGSALAGPTGRAEWQMKLSAGLHRFRVRYFGADDLAAATSRPLGVRVVAP